MADDDMRKAFEDLHNLAAVLEASGPLVARDLDGLTVATGHLVEGQAKINAPVDTGALRSSIGTDVERDGSGRGYAVSVEVGPTVNYGAHVELGTEHMAPEPYLGPAFDQYAPGFTAACEVLSIPKALR